MLSWQDAPLVENSGAPIPGRWQDAPLVDVNQSQQPGVLQQILEPVTSIPSTYASMVRGAEDTMGKGARQVRQGLHELGTGDFREGLKDAGIGAGRAALGAANYVSSPISAPIHTLFGEPTRKAVTDLTGSPKIGDIAGNTAELGASVFLPLPSRLPRFGRGATEASIVPTIEDLKEASAEGYNHPEVKRLAIKPAALQKWKDELTVSLDEDGLDDATAPRTTNVLKSLDKAPDGAFVSGRNLNSLRKKLGHMAKLNDPAERAAAYQAMHSLDTFVSGIPGDAVLHGDPARVASIFSDARGNWAAAKRAESVDAALDRATYQSGSSGSGMNLDNAQRQRIKDILANPNRRRGFSDAEIAHMKRIVLGSRTANVARKLGNVLGGGRGPRSYSCGYCRPRRRGETRISSARSRLRAQAA
jgi:hypothetical protein